MHHDYVLIISHLGADLKSITNSLDLHPEITVASASMIYSTPPDLIALRSICEKKKVARFYVDSILQNHALRCPALHKTCKFIYFLDKPDISINRIIVDHHYQPEAALAYYAFRLQRIASMVTETQDAMLVTHEDLNDAPVRMIEYLPLKSRITPFTANGADKPLDPDLMKKAEEIYKRYAKAVKNVFTQTVAS